MPDTTPPAPPEALDELARICGILCDLYLHASDVARAQAMELLERLASEGLAITPAKDS